MDKEIINTLAKSIRNIHDKQYKDMVDNLIATHIKNTKDEEFVKERSSAYFLYDDEFVSVNLIELAINYKLEETLCAIIEKLPNLVEIDDIHFPTIIHKAMASNMTKVGITALIRNPKWATIPDHYNRTFVHIAMAHRLEPIGWLALKVCPESIGILDVSKNTYAHIAMKQGLYELGEAILTTRPEIGSIKNVENLTIMEECEQSKKLNNKIKNESKSDYEIVEKLLQDRQKALTDKTK